VVEQQQSFVCPHALDWSEVQRDPHATFARHRAEHWWAPIAGSDAVEVLAYEPVRDLMANDRQLLEYLGGHLEDMARANPDLSPALLEAMRETAAQSLINMDGPAHHRLRNLVARAFTPRSVAALAPFLEATAERLAASLTSGCDFMQTFAREMPARALCELTGIPAEDHETFAGWIEVLQVQLSPADLLKLSREDSERVFETHVSLRDYCRGLVRERRANPRDDLVSRVAHDGDADFGDEVIAALVSDLIFAGNDTTKKALGSMVMLLAEQQETWERVAVEPSYAAPAVEEVLRLQGPAPGPVRRACERVEHRGDAFEAGQIAALSIWSANRDPDFWGDDPHAFDPERANLDQHLAFGHGPHFCLGASLAREELRAALVALTSQLTDVHVLEPPAMTPVGSIYGPLELRLGFRRRRG
jgi:cytochrome P450